MRNTITVMIPKKQKHASRNLIEFSTSYKPTCDDHIIPSAFLVLELSRRSGFKVQGPKLKFLNSPGGPKFDLNILLHSYLGTHKYTMHQ
jgi:hypothetical protein